MSPLESPTALVWRRMLALVTAFAVGGTLGASGWHLYENAADPAATDSQVDLLAGFPMVPLEQPAREPIAGLPPIPRELTVAVFNLGQREVAVLQARPAGWTLTADLELTPVAAWEWTNLSLAIAPDCEEPARPELDLVVRTDGGDRDVTIPLVPDFLTWLHGEACSNLELTGVAVDDVGAIAVEEESLRMEVDIRHIQPTGASELTVTALSAESAGFRAEGTGLPVTLRPSDPGVTIELLWTVEHCELTDRLADIPLIAQITSPDFAVRDQPLELPGRGVAALGRFGGGQCSDRP
ncbi:MAG TPA: hypothetical protein VFZ63_05880 [Jiangellaceae bacterium]